MKKIFLPSLLLVSLGLSVIFLLKDVNISSDESSLISRYIPKNIDEFKFQDTKNANGAFEYRKMIYQDLVTGEINQQQLAKAKSQVRNKMMSKNSNISFVEEGPDNVGGRTRSIAVDPNQPKTMFAGSVTGGLFVSYNKGNNWQRVQEFDDAMINSSTGTGSISISSIAITKDSVLYVATGGEEFEGTVTGEGSGITQGDGLWFSNSLTNFNFQQVSYTNNKDILKVVADPIDNSTVYFVGDMGLGLGKDNLGSDVSFAVSDPNTPYSVNTKDIVDFRISNDGQLMIMGVQAGKVDTWISQDAGNSWTNIGRNNTDPLYSLQTFRAEYSISDSLNSSNNYTIYAAFATTGGILHKVFRSEDNGNSWCEIGAYSPSFKPLSSGGNPQGRYNLCLLSSADGESCTLGGIDLYKWQHTPGTVCYNGQWNQETYWFLPPNSPGYTHADNHFLDYNSDGDMIVGNDGGIGIRYGQPWGSSPIYQLPLNKGYNVTQFYSMGMGGDGSVIAGAQDNGTQYKDGTVYNTWPKTFTEVNGGDGFECEISYLNNNVLITTLYYNNIQRSSDRGENFQNVNFGTDQTDPFYSAIALMETANDLKTQDSIIFTPSISMSAGDTVTYYSENMSIPMQHILSQDLNVYYDSLDPTTVVSTDTIILPDYIQSLFVCQRGAGVYATRDMLRFSSNLVWWKLFDISSNMHSFEISADMNYAWCGSGSNLKRVSGLSNAYTYQAADLNYKPSSSDTLLLVSNLPQASDNIFWINVPTSNDSLIHLSTGDTITGTSLDTINYSNDYSQYNYIDGSSLESTITGSDFSQINLNTDIYSYSNGNPIDVVRTGSFISNINFETDYTLYVNTDYSPVVYCVNTKTLSQNFGIICDISVDPLNPDNVMVTSGGTSGTHVYYSTNGTSANPTFTAKDGDLPDMPVFGCVIERGTDNSAIIGTEYGVFSTEDITVSSPTWTPNNDELGPIPVFDITQQWRDWEDGLGNGIRRVGNPGAIYACTFGRGIWRADELLSTPDHYNFSSEEISKVKLFPNPSNDNTNITFNLNNSSDVSIQIFDLQGKLVQTVYNNTKLFAGEHNVNFNVSNLQLGTYMVLLNTNSERKVVKFIKY